MCLTHDELRDLARSVGLALVAIAHAEPFPGLADLLRARIREGYLRGMDWFDERRAETAADPRALHPTVRSFISVALPYWLPDIRPPDDGIPRGRIARYAWGRDYHRVLRDRMRQLHRLLEHRLGRPIEARFLVDTARIVDREVAVRAGLGWQGKNTLVIVPQHGSWVLLGELLVDIDLEPNTPLRPRCGRCRRCLDDCPTGALVAPYALFAPRCISYLTIEHRGPIPWELRPLMGNWVFGCDLCQEVCPYTAAARPADDPVVRPERLEHCYPSLTWLLRMTESEFRDVYRGRPVLRTKRAGLARNAAVALGNIGDARHLDVLEETLQGHDQPLVRSHAAWAMARIDFAASEPVLRRALDRETDPAVHEELERLLTDPPLPVSPSSVTPLRSR
ncbi:MAG: tRNA epoxyqueuosine(34) reductase QueG [Thermomicrobium sp.]|nr:tRNA epoxyqueuosine(34) reductase QueG [Thermomicrobium sp.]MCS7246420.1 tRNA epoxyqueuosine(34) reductase QueG [Thermomicrobium sp.]MDW7981922.1 tRNA epoxyqueuosine(34) reductase QueG [Thermomicrobium sp.]